MSSKFNIENEEVLYSKDPLVKVDKTDINKLIMMASTNRRRRIRLCAHPGLNNAVHEMIIVQEQFTYNRPHCHNNKSESFHIIIGRLALILFDDEGVIKKRIEMGDFLSGNPFYFRIPEKINHTAIPLSNYVVFQEVTRGPFQKTNTEYPKWAPEEKDHKNISEYINNLLTCAAPG